MIREGKLYCAGAYLPSTRREDINKAFGTRHRAAIGISEISDSITLWYLKKQDVTQLPTKES